MPLPPKDFLDQLADLQRALEGYSLEKLTVAKALEVRESFQHLLEVMETCPFPFELVKQAQGAVPILRERPENTPASDSPLEDAGILCHTENPLAYGALGKKLHGLGSRVYLAADSAMLLHLASSASIDLILIEATAPLRETNTLIGRLRSQGHPLAEGIPLLVVSKNAGSPLKPGPADSCIYTLNSPSEAELFDGISGLIEKHRSPGPPGNDHLPVALTEQKSIPADSANEACSLYTAGLPEPKDELRNLILEYIGRMRLAIRREDFIGIADACRIVLPHLHQWGAGVLLDFTEDILDSALKGRDLERIEKAQQEFLSLYPVVLKSLDGLAGV